MRRTSASIRQFLTATPFAHRGRFGRGTPENSLRAFRAAIAAGEGIECDIRLSRDGVAHVFHDRTLKRMIGRRGLIGELDSQAIARLRLAGTDEGVPLLSELLPLCGATPLLIEIKSDQGAAYCRRVCSGVASALRDHAGPVAVISFDPLVSRWFARRAPHIMRGFTVSTHYDAGFKTPHAKRLAIARARPHFLCCDVRDFPQAASLRANKPMVLWTLRTTRDHAMARRHGAGLIVEG